MIDTIALFIKGLFLGGLLGFAVPALYLVLLFGLPQFVELISSGSSVAVVLAGLISVPFSVIWLALFEGSLISTTLAGAGMGLAIALVVLVMRRADATKRTVALVCGVLALVVAIIFGLTQQATITQSTGLVGMQVWILCGIYVALAAWLGWKLREESVA